MRGNPVGGASADDQVSSVIHALAVSARADGAYVALGHLPYATAEQFRSAEDLLAGAIRSGDATVGPLRGLEALARRNRKLLPLQDVTLDRLRAIGDHAGTRARSGAAPQRRGRPGRCAGDGRDDPDDDSEGR